jgi:hypothetical protein
MQTTAHKSRRAKLNALDLPGGIMSAANLNKPLLRAGFAGIGKRSAP